MNLLRESTTDDLSLVPPQIRLLMRPGNNIISVLKNMALMILTIAIIYYILGIPYIILYIILFFAVSSATYREAIYDILFWHMGFVWDIYTIIIFDFPRSLY